MYFLLPSFVTYKVAVTKAERGFFNVVFLLFICDLRLRVKGNCSCVYDSSMCEESKKGKRIQGPNQLAVAVMIQRKTKVKNGGIGSDKKQGGKKESGKETLKEWGT